MALLLVEAVALSATTTLDQAAARTTGVTCRRPGSRVLLVDGEAMVFRASAPGKLPEYKATFGCVRGGAAYDLGEVPKCAVSRECGGARRERLAGADVAYESLFVTGEEARWFVDVRNLRSGRLVRHVPTGVPLTARPGFFTGVGPTKEIVVKADGSVAWIAEDLERSSGELPLYFDVYASDASGTRLLASGSNVAPTSLALAGSTIYWTQEGHAFSSPLR
jgi:hypothetical protein